MYDDIQKCFYVHTDITQSWSRSNLLPEYLKIYINFNIFFPVEYHYYLKQKYKAYTQAMLAAQKTKVPKKYVLVKGVPPTPRPGYKFVAIYPNKVNPYL